MRTRRLIIEYPVDFGAVKAIGYAKKVVERGKISVAAGVDHYCWLSVFSDGIQVATRQKRHNSSADSLLVSYDKGWD